MLREINCHLLESGATSQRRAVFETENATANGMESKNSFGSRGSSVCLEAIAMAEIIYEAIRGPVLSHYPLPVGQLNLFRDLSFKGLMSPKYKVSLNSKLTPSASR